MTADDWLRASMDAVCVGETMAMLVPDPPDQGDTFRRYFGGAESNVAVHLARAGFTVAWRSALGDDVFGGYIRDQLTAEGVECLAPADPARPTGVYFKELTAGGTRARYYRAGSAASALGAGDAADAVRLRPRLIHTTGITPALSESCRALTERLLDAGPSIRSFDVNLRPALHGTGSAEMLRDLAGRADVTFVGLDEAQALWDVKTPEDVRRLLPAPGTLVVKQGADGATAFRDGRSWFHPAPAVEVVEPVGAGDAFAGGFLRGVLDDAPPDRCLAEGSRLAGLVLQVHGDLPPPTAA